MRLLHNMNAFCWSKTAVTDGAKAWVAVRNDGEMGRIHLRLSFGRRRGRL